MTIPAIDPANLPTIPTAVRRWIYAIYLLALATANSVDAYYDTGDPHWLPGTLRVLNVVGLFVAAVALVNARPTVAEQAKKQLEEARHPDSPDAPDLREGELGLPGNLRRPPTDDGLPPVA